MRKDFAAVVLSMVIGSTLSAEPQPAPSLSIGDRAPELLVMKWLKGDPVERFEPGRIYVVDFFATWCGPCNEEMPRLSKLAAKYKDHVTIIGISTREADRSKNVDAKFVQDFVARKGDKLAYSVAMDDLSNNATYKKWAVAAGMENLPSCFIVDGEGNIARIGTATDEVLNAMIAGTFARNQDDARAQHLKDFQRAALSKPLIEAINRKDWNAAMIEAQDQMQKDPGYESKVFWTLAIPRLQLDSIGALEYVKSKSQDLIFMSATGYTGGQARVNFLNTFAIIVASQDGLDPEVYQFAVSQLREALSKSSSGYFKWSVLAQAYAQLKDYKNAVAAQEKAVAALDALPATEQQNIEYTRASMKARLASYESEIHK